MNKNKKSKKHKICYKYEIKNDTYFILNLEKSRFSDNFYIYIGFSYSNPPIKYDWDSKNPNIYSCNVSCNLNGISNNLDNITCPKIFEFIYKNNRFQYDFIEIYNHQGYELEDCAKWMEKY